MIRVWGKFILQDLVALKLAVPVMIYKADVGISLCMRITTMN